MLGELLNKIYLLLKTLNSIWGLKRKYIFLFFPPNKTLGSAVYCIGYLSEVACVIRHRSQVGLCTDAMANFQDTFLWHLYHGITGENKNHTLIFQPFCLLWKSASFPPPFYTVQYLQSCHLKFPGKGKQTKNRAKSPAGMDPWDAEWQLALTRNQHRFFFSSIHDHIQPKVQSVPHQIWPASAPASRSCPPLENS